MSPSTMDQDTLCAPVITETMYPALPHPVSATLVIAENNADVVSIRLPKKEGNKVANEKQYRSRNAGSTPPPSPGMFLHPSGVYKTAQPAATLTQPLPAFSK
jgi:hypothetical protein